jgi:hypothetical protein
MGIAIYERLWFGLRFRVEPGMTGVIMVYKFVFFTILSSTFPLIRGKRSELTTHKIVNLQACNLLYREKPQNNRYTRLSDFPAPLGAKYW